MFSNFNFPQVDWENMPRSKIVALAVGVALVLIVGGMAVSQKGGGKGSAAKISVPSDVTVPSIVNGELVLPRVTAGPSAASSLDRVAGRLGVLSANLVAIFNSSSGTISGGSGQTKLAGLRILGEVQNLSDSVIDGISSVITFFDADGKVVGKKIAKTSPGFDFFSLSPRGTTLYDLTVDNLPVSDKLEVVINATSATASAVFEPLKIASRSVEVKTAKYQNGQQLVTGNGQAGTGSAESTPSASGDTIEYYTVAGSVFNQLTDPVSDISVYAWVKDAEGKVFSFGRQDFKNDLISPSDKIDFRINLLPLKTGEKYDSYELAVWGKRYKLNL